MKYFWLWFFLNLTLFAQTLPVTTTYEINLAWIESAPDPSDPSQDLAVGYVIYRSSDGVNYQPLNEDLIAANSYVDNSLLYGVSYYYYVESVDAQNNSSTPSNIVLIGVPFVPYSPVLGVVTQ